MKILLSVTKKPNLKKPILICGWPGMGEVAFKLVNYLKDKLKMEEFATLEAPELFPPTGVWIENTIVNLPKSGKGKFYFYKNKAGFSDLIVFIGDAQPLLEHAYDYCKKILSFGKELKARRLFTFAAIAQAIDHTVSPEVWYGVTSKRIIAELNLSNSNLKPLNGGQVSGLNGLILGIAKDAGFEGICLLAEIPLFTMQIENPKSALAILNKLVKMINIEIDASELSEQAKIMEQEIEKLIEYIHSPEQLHAPSPISEDEIEKMKKTLSLYTKLPQSAREKIEKLFLEAKLNITKATELKKELDQWNVYKEYEDRFLDLFKKPKDKSEKPNN